jgi:hypothetical protein
MDLPERRGSASMAGVLMIEEYVHSEKARDDHEIYKMRNIYMGSAKAPER